MSIKHVILGFLSDSPMTGYDLKKKFSSSEIFHWSGNNNQIYKALLELHEEALVSLEVYPQENKPPRKVYTIAASGIEALRQWLKTIPSLPQVQSPLLMQLNWAHLLSSDELKALLLAYRLELTAHLELLQGQAKRNDSPSPLAKRISEQWISFYQLELDWIKQLEEE